MSFNHITVEQLAIWRAEARARVAAWRNADHVHEWRGHVVVITKAMRAEWNTQWAQAEGLNADKKI